MDMALVYGVFTPERILETFERERLPELAGQAAIYLPGLATNLTEALAKGSGHLALAGPVCAAELPLFFGESRWKLA